MNPHTDKVKRAKRSQWKFGYAMILLFIFIIGCFVTAIVTMGLIFAMAAVGYGTEGETLETQTQGDSEILQSESRETNGRAREL